MALIVNASTVIQCNGTKYENYRKKKNKIRNLVYILKALLLLSLKFIYLKITCFKLYLKKKANFSLYRRVIQLSVTEYRMKRVFNF